ncbi:MAG: VWA domain-containing protein [Fimbriimonadales bacterium]|nr:VWA domain-containing protein [Fimbriimonadales bacterium]
MARSRGSRSRGYEGDGQNPLLVGLILLGVLLLVGLAGWGVWNYSQSQTLKTPLAVGAGFDVSQSVSKAQKQRAVAFLNKMIGTVLPPRTPTKIWRYAESFETVHESRPIASRELNAVSRETIENFLGKWGTRPDKVMQEFSRYAQQQPDRKLVLCLLTDGECHAAAETRAQAAQLAQSPQVVAVIVGPVLNQYRASVENDYYAPLRDAGKLFVFGETDALDTLERVKQHLRSIEP